MPESLVLDAGTGSAINLMADPYALLSHEYPAPNPKLIWASNANSEGALPVGDQHENREIAISVETRDAGALSALEGKIAKLHREGGSIVRTLAGGEQITFDVLAVPSWAPLFDHRHHLADVTQVSFTLTCAPYGRGVEQDLGDNVETTAPALIFTETAVPGDVSALGRLVIDNDSSADQWWVTVGAENDLDYTFTDSTGTGGLLYQAESRTPLGGAATAAGPSGASGSGSNVVRHTSLSTSEIAVLGTQASGGGAHLTHVGRFRIYARVQVPTTNTGTVSISWTYLVGDGMLTSTNPAVPLDPALEGEWRLIDLGPMMIGTTTGAHRWEGRIVAKSTVEGDDIDIDYLMLVPANPYGVGAGVQLYPPPTAFTARDSFDQTAGALNSKTLPVGGTWATSGGDTDDLQVASGRVTRSSVSDSPLIHGVIGRVAIAGSTTLSNASVQMQAKTSAFAGPSSGLIARRLDTGNFLFVNAYWGVGGNLVDLVLWRVLGGTPTNIASAQFQPVGGLLADTYYTLRLVTLSSGRALVWFFRTSSPERNPIINRYDPALAGGGALATGTVGFYDGQPFAGACTRSYDAFEAYALPKDAAMFAGQSLELRHDGAARENAAGTAWSRIGNAWSGSFLKLAPAGQNSRTSRLLIKACRNDPAALPDPALDDISARLYATPRYLTVPQP